MRSAGALLLRAKTSPAVLDSLIWCKFLRKAFDDLYEESAEIYRHITGWDMTAEELRLAGERINNLKKQFNIREGWSRDDDTLPPRVFDEVAPYRSSGGSGLEQAGPGYDGAKLLPSAWLV